MGRKIATTLTIDEDVKKDFKIECTMNEVEMSETVEIMMKDYVKISREIKESNKESV